MEESAVSKVDMNDLPEQTQADTQVARVATEEFRAAFGESLSATLDLDTWEPGENLVALYGRLEQEVTEAVKQENRIREQVRKEIFPLLKSRPHAPKPAGVFAAKVPEIEYVHSHALFNGSVEACDATSVVHDTLPVTIAQIGVCLVSYKGDHGSWVHRLFRRDLRVGGMDPVEEALEVLEQRQRRTGTDSNGGRVDRLSNLARRGIMTYAERAVLLQKTNAPWRMGHGNPAPYELLTGSGMKDLIDASLEVLYPLLAKHKRFVFVPSAPASRFLRTLGNALYPLEYAIVDTLEESISRIVEQGHYRGDWSGLSSKVMDFARDVASKIVVGTYKTTGTGPAQVFYAHVDHAHEAALIAMGDSALQEHRGFPMLIDLADTICTGTFGGDSFQRLTELAYLDAGEPFRYLSERQTRR